MCSPLSQIFTFTTLDTWLLRSRCLLLALVLATAAFLPTARGLLPSPKPDGGYPNSNTAEGDGALFSVTTGGSNTAVGFQALYSDTTGGNNTATGYAALFS